VILRDAAQSDEAELQDFDLGAPPTIWLDEVSEILSGLIAWRDDETQADLDRLVIVGDINGEMVAVAAHECSEHDRHGPLAAERYLMVVAVRSDHRQDGIATTLAESIIADMQRSGVRSVHWLVYPTNLASISFSRSVFPEADETYPPEDRPYVRFVLSL
jgi:ribosomal protein S18 acetylase RimI-like enzyme